LGAIVVSATAATFQFVANVRAQMHAFVKARRRLWLGADAGVVQRNNPGTE
jgi:hypothetical protein